MFRFQQLLLLIIIFLFSIKSNAQCCSGGVPIAGTLGTSSSPHKSWDFLLSYNLNQITDLINEINHLKDNLRTRKTNSILLETSYGLTKKITTTVMFTWIRQERIITLNSGMGTDFESGQGIGDAIILFKYRFTKNKSPYSFVLGAGPKIPLGSTSKTKNNGLLLSADMQPGSGSLDLMLWGYFNKSGFLTPNLSSYLSATYKYSGTNGEFQGIAYQFGKQLQINGGLSYRYTKNKIPFDFTTALQYRHVSYDIKGDNNTLPNSGGQFIFISPMLVVNFNPKLSLRLGANIPAYRKMNGTQLATSKQYNIGINFKIPHKNQTNTIFNSPKNTNNNEK